MSTLLSKRVSGLLTALACAVQGAGMSGCGRIGSITEKPDVNPQPQKILRITGAVDESLSIKVSTTYISAEKKCRRVTNRFAGASAPLSERVAANVIRSGTAYEARVAFDHFLEGRCRWYPYTIEFQITDSAGLTTGSFATVGEVTSHVAGPVPVIWIHTRGKGDPTLLGSGAGGAASIAPLLCECHRTQRGNAAGLQCIPASRGNVAKISEEAREVQVDFRGP